MKGSAVGAVTDPASASVRAVLWNEACAMARYAISSGLKVPVPVLELLDGPGGDGVRLADLAAAHGSSG